MFVGCPNVAGQRSELTGEQSTLKIKELLIASPAE
jgi:hypothetical protein